MNETMADNQRGSRKMSLPFELWFTCQTGETEENQVTIDEDGIAAEISYSVPGMPLRALGAYNIQLLPNDPDISAMADLIREYGLITENPFEMNPRPGMRSKMFHIEMDNIKSVHLVNAREPLPPPLLALERHITQLMSRLNTGPLCTLSINISIEPFRARPGDEIKIVLEMRNRGKFTVEFRNPVHFKTGGPSAFKLNFWKTSKNQAEIDTFNFAFAFDLIGREFLYAQRQAISSTEPFLKIGSDETLHTWTKIRLPKAESAHYNVELVYYAAPLSAHEMKEIPHIIVGEYHSDPIPLEIMKPGKKR